MVLKFFEIEIEKILEHSSAMEFSELIRACREALGLMQCKAAEFIGIMPNRLKILEQGAFSQMPSSHELAGLSRLYDIKLSYLEEKAERHVRQKSKRYIPPKMLQLRASACDR